MCVQKRTGLLSGSSAQMCMKVDLRNKGEIDNSYKGGGDSSHGKASDK